VVPGSRTDRDNHAIPIGKNVIAVYLAPFVALGWTTQVILAVVHSISAAPVFIVYLCAPLPLIMVAICAIVMAILVLMFLRDGGQADEG